MRHMRINWPGGVRAAVMLAFDFDAETLWAGRDPASARLPGVLGQGRYEARTGVPKLLEVAEARPAAHERAAG